MSVIMEHGDIANGYQSDQYDASVDRLYFETSDPSSAASSSKSPRHRLTFDRPNYAGDMLQRLNRLRSDACLTDTILCVGDKGEVEFPCHRNVLAACSTYFRTMFSSDLKEKHQLRVSFSEILPVTLKSVIDFSYTGHIEITVDNAQDLLSAGSMFQYPDIVVACCQFLGSHISPANCLGIEQFAAMHSCRDLEELSNKTALDNFSQVIEYEEFVQLPCDRLMAYASSDLIDVHSEELVYRAIRRWLDYIATDTDTSSDSTSSDGSGGGVYAGGGKRRERYTCRLMALIRVATLPPQTRRRIRSDDSHISLCTRCSALFDANRLTPASTGYCQSRRGSNCSNTSTGEPITLACIQNICSTVAEKPVNTETPRKSTLARRVMVLVGGITDSSVSTLEDYQSPVSTGSGTKSAFVYSNLDTTSIRITRTVEMYDACRNKWSQLPSLPSSTNWFATTSADNNIYVTGGIDQSRGLVTDAWMFDSARRQWCRIADLLRPRARHSSCSWTGNIYVVGGITLDHDSAATSVQAIEAYSQASGQWTEVGQSPFPRTHACLVSYGDQIIEIGGTQRDVKVQSVECYTCTNDGVQYSIEQFMLPTSIQYASVCCSRPGVFYIIWQDTRQFIRLDLHRRTFTRLASLLRVHVHSGATILDDGCVYVSGGLKATSGRERTPCSWTECYDPDTDTWRQVLSAGLQRAAYGCVAIDMT